MIIEKLKIGPELVDEDSGLKLVMNPDSFEGWKYLRNCIERCVRTARLN